MTSLYKSLRTTRLGSPQFSSWFRFRKLRVTLFWVLGIGVIAALAAVGTVATHLAFPRVPQSIPSLQFKGFVALPTVNNSGALSVMDYMTVEGRSLYVASIKPGAVFKVPLDGKFLPIKSDIAAVPGAPSAHGVVFKPDGHVGFISRSGANTVDVFDTASLKIVKSIPVPLGVDGIFFDPANNLVYAASGTSKSATLIDANTHAIVGRLDLASKPEFAVFDPVTHLIYQNLEETNEFAVIDGAKQAVVGRWTLAGCEAPTGAAIDVENRRLFIACSGNATLVVVSLDTNSVVASTTIGEQADSVAYDPQLKRIYTTGRPGILAVTQQESADSYRDIGRIGLEYGAHTLAVDPLTHRVYVGYVSLFTEARLAIFDAQ